MSGEDLRRPTLTSVYHKWHAVILVSVFDQILKTEHYAALETLGILLALCSLDLFRVRFISTWPKKELKFRELLHLCELR